MSKKTSHSEALQRAAHARAAGDRKTARLFSQMARDLQKGVTTKKTSGSYRDKSGRISHVTLGSEKHKEAIESGKTQLSDAEIRRIRRTTKTEIKPQPTKTELKIGKQTVKQDGKVLYTIGPGKQPGTYTKTYSTKKWTVTYDTASGPKTKVFDTQREAKTYVSQRKLKAKVTAHKRIEASFSAEEKEYWDQMYNINLLIEKGLAKRVSRYGTRYGKAAKEGAKIALTKDPSGFTDELAEIARKAGFDIEMAEGPSFKLFEWGQKATKEGSFTRSQTEYYSNVLGHAEQSIGNIWGRIIGAVTGKPVRFRSVSEETLGYTKNLSKRQKVYLAVGAAGGNYLGNYISVLPLGVSASVVCQGAKNIASATGVSTPAGISKIAREIAKHPRLAKAIMWAPIVGIEANEVYADYKAGKPFDEILSKEMMRGGTLLGQIQGLEAGFKIPTKVKEWYATRGRTPIPPEELWRAETLNSNDRLITYTNKNYKTTWSKEFKDLGKKLTAEKYLGKVAPEEYRLWHCTGNPWDVRLDETTLAMIGDHTEKFPGLFMASEPQHHFLRYGLNVGEVGSYRLGLPGIKGVSEIVSIDALVEVMPEGMSRTATQAWLAKQLGTKTAYIPPISMITSELEAIIPPNSKLVKIGEEWYTNWAGHSVLVNKYALLPEGVPLSALPKGAKIVELSALTSTALPTLETYLTYGIVPPKSMLSSMTLTPKEITELSKLYGLSESEIRAITSTLSTTRAGITGATTSTEMDPKLTMSDLTGKLEEIDPGVIDEPIPISDEEPIPISDEEPPPKPPEEPPPKPPEEPPPPPPPRTEEMRQFQAKLLHGPIEVYQVTFNYRRGPSQILPIEAHSFPEALQKAQRARRPNRQHPSMVDIVRLGKKTKFEKMEVSPLRPLPPSRG